MWFKTKSHLILKESFWRQENYGWVMNRTPSQVFGWNYGREKYRMPSEVPGITVSSRNFLSGFPDGFFVSWFKRSKTDEGSLEIGKKTPSVLDSAAAGLCSLLDKNWEYLTMRPSVLDSAAAGLCSLLDKNWEYLTMRPSILDSAAAGLCSLLDKNWEYLKIRPLVLESAADCIGLLFRGNSEVLKVRPRTRSRLWSVLLPSAI